ncbi:hypothetical protein [Actinoplanes sp. NPDC049599]|uniref:hypothetical protein n=1 Tax=Actinoplanes sp. NPDC049599 TaxID=3363903 RepID=UPI003798BD2B
MITYELGRGVTIEHQVRNSALELTDATAVLTITRPDATTDTPAVTHVSTGIYRAPTFQPNQLSVWRYRWDISGAVTDVAFGAFLVVDGTLPPPGAYAARTDLAGVIPVVPDNAEQLLVRASRDVDRALLTAVYDPTDPAVIAALRDATVEQVAGNLGSGDKTGLGITTTPQGFTLGKLSVQKPAAPASAPRTGVLVDQAWSILQAAGLTGQSPSTEASWNW